MNTLSNSLTCFTISEPCINKLIAILSGISPKVLKERFRIQYKNIVGQQFTLIDGNKSSVIHAVHHYMNITLWFRAANECGVFWGSRGLEKWISQLITALVVLKR